MFRKVAKVALPVIAIGAAVLTGGAALGVLGPMALGSLGLSAGLTSVISMVGTGALLGGATSLITGGNIIKGMTMGGIAGGVAGGLGAAFGYTGGALGMGSGAAQAAGGAASGASEAVTAGSQSLVTPGATVSTTGATAADAAAQGIAAGVADPIIVNGVQAAGSGLGSAVAPVSAAALALPTLPDASQPAPSQSQQLSDQSQSLVEQQTVGAPPAESRGGIGGFLERNQMLAAMGMQGLGSAMQGSDNAAVELLDARGENYGAGRLYQGGHYTPEGAQTPGERFGPPVYATKRRWQFDPASGQIVQVEAAG